MWYKIYIEYGFYLHAFLIHIPFGINILKIIMIYDN